MIDIPIIGASFGVGAPTGKCRVTPYNMKHLTPSWNWMPILDRLEYRSDLAYMEALATLTNYVIKAYQPIGIIGGNHSVAIGTWSGISHALNQDLGLIWIDAHLDAHTPRTSLSGNLHGMPLANLLGVGPFDSVISPALKLDPRNVIVLGARDYEPAEARLLNDLGVRVIGMDEINQYGFVRMLNYAIDSLETEHYGISLDVDAIDPRYMPSVDTPVSGGISPSALMTALRFVDKRRLLALEIVEYQCVKSKLTMETSYVIELVEKTLKRLDKQP